MNLEGPKNAADAIRARRADQTAHADARERFDRGSLIMRQIAGTARLGGVVLSTGILSCDMNAINRLTGDPYAPPIKLHRFRLQFSASYNNGGPAKAGVQCDR
jgi:hypothetical protein